MKAFGQLAFGRLDSEKNISENFSFGELSFEKMSRSRKLRFYNTYCRYQTLDLSTSHVHNSLICGDCPAVYAGQMGRQLKSPLGFTGQLDVHDK
jgi:hypothetical protein